MKFGYNRPNSSLSVPSHESNLIQKMLIALGLFGIVSVYAFKDDGQHSLKRDAKAAGPVAVFDKKSSLETPTQPEKQAEASKPRQIFERYLSFKDHVEPGMPAHFVIKALPGGSKYSINFGDGSPEQAVSSLRAEHVYRRDGEFKVTLTAEFNGQKQALPPLNIYVHEAVEIAEIATEVEIN